MVLKDDESYESKDELTKDTILLKEHEELPEKGDILVTMRTLSVQPKIVEEKQRTNLFHMKCLVHGKVCSLVIDGGHCTNVARRLW